MKNLIKRPSYSPPHPKEREEYKSGPEGEEGEEDVASSSESNNRGSEFGSENRYRREKGESSESTLVEVHSPRQFNILYKLSLPSSHRLPMRVPWDIAII